MRAILRFSSLLPVLLPLAAAAQIEEVRLFDELPFGTLQAIGDAVYFRASGGPHGTELWRSDGTTAGTVLVKDIQPGPGSGVLDMRMVAHEGILYFIGDDGEHGAELWRSDGTEAGTFMVADLRPGPLGGSIEFITGFQGKVLFQGNPGTFNNAVLHVYDPASGQVEQLAVGLYQRLNMLQWPVRFGDRLLLPQARFESGSTLGHEPWLTDLTTAGTELL